MVQWPNVLAAKPNELSLIPGLHMAEERIDSHRLFSDSLDTMSSLSLLMLIYSSIGRALA